MIQTKLTDLLGVEHPIVGFNRSPAVVTEVSRAGGYGVLGAVAYTAEQLDAQLTWIEEQLDGRPYGVDLLVPEKTAAADAADVVASLRAQIPAEHLAFVDELLARYGIPVAADAGRGDEVVAGMSRAGAEAQLDVVFAHRPTLVANALGAPPPHLVERAHGAGMAVASLVGARRHAERQLAAGVDVLVAQGTEAGGHTGTVATTVLTPEIVDVARGKPVLAAGGIASGDQMAAALALGASGVWCGSVWLASHEDVAPESVKRKFLAAGSSDTVRSRARTGKPARQLRTAWHDAWEADGAPAPLPMPLQPLLTQRAFTSIDAAAERGHEGAGALQSFFVGQVVGAFAELRGAGEITRDMARGCEERIAALATLVRAGAPSS
ncbi:NAD(P)H-dependent flavin oxidoreductase [Actinomycetospora sp. C-140]